MSMGASDSIFPSDVIRTSEFEAVSQPVDPGHTRHEMAIAALLQQAQEIASGELVLPVKEDVVPIQVDNELDLDPTVIKLLDDIDAIFRKIEATKLIDSLPLE